MEQTLLVVECPAIKNGGKFPLIHTGRGDDVSPEFRLKNLTPESKTLAVILEDLDHPLKQFTHWTVWNLPAKDIISPALPKGGHTLDGAVQGIGYGFHRYAGPKPPKGRTHQYRFTIFALDTVLSLGPRAGKRIFLRAAAGHILQIGSLTASFE